MSDAGAKEGLQGHQGRGKPERGSVSSRVKRFEDMVSLMFFVLASPGFGVSAYLQCGIQGKRIGTQLRSIRFLFCTESNHWYQSGYLEENLIQNTYGFNILKGLFIFTC